jgi:hypothetical protein
MKSLILALIAIAIIAVIIKGGFISCPRFLARILKKKKVMRELNMRGIYGTMIGDRYVVKLEDLTPIWVTQTEEAEPLPFPKPKKESEGEKEKSEESTAVKVEINPKTEVIDIQSLINAQAGNEPMEEETPIPQTPLPVKQDYGWIDINKLVFDLRDVANIYIDNKYYELFTYKDTAYLHTVGLLNRIRQMAKSAGVQLREGESDRKELFKYLVDAFRNLGLVDENILPQPDTYYKYEIIITGKPRGKNLWGFIPLKAAIFANMEARKSGWLLNIERVEKKS